MKQKYALILLLLLLQWNNSVSIINKHVQLRSAAVSHKILVDIFLTTQSTKRRICNTVYDTADKSMPCIATNYSPYVRRIVRLI